MNREEHLNWCKQRALEYLETGDTENALASMFSDLKKHPETQAHPAIELGIMLMFIQQLNTTEEVRKFIEGFN